MSQAGAARARVVDRTDWVRANLSSYQRLLRPMLSRMEDKLDGPVATLSGKVAAVELGALLGWMSTRVLGQYDLLVLEDENPEDQDLVYYVGPNILGLEKRHSFPPTSSGCGSRCTRSPTAPSSPAFRGCVSTSSASSTSCSKPPTRIRPSCSPRSGGVADSLRTRTNPLKEGGLAALFASTEQLAVMDQVGGLMSLLEGHGDVTMDRAAASAIPSAERFARVLRSRRVRGERRGPKILQRLIGLEAKLAQYEQGERFIAAVEAVGRPAAPEPGLRPAREPAVDAGDQGSVDVAGPGLTDRFGRVTGSRRTRVGSAVTVSSDPIRIDPVRSRRRPPARAVHDSHPRAPRWCAGSRAAPTRPRCSPWRSRPGWSSRPSTSTTACDAAVPRDGHHVAPLAHRRGVRRSDPCRRGGRARTEPGGAGPHGPPSGPAARRRCSVTPPTTRPRPC